VNTNVWTEILKGISRLRYEDNTGMDLREGGCEFAAHDVDELHAVVNTVMNLRFHKKNVEFVD